MEKKLKQLPNNLIKVVLFGPESTGKTTLSKQLAQYYNTVWVPEYLREFAQKKWDEEQKICAVKDIIPIAKGQINLENQCAKQAKNILICDTNLLETKTYAEIYFEGYENHELTEAALKNKYDIYFLTYIDTPWKADDLRDKPNERAQMFKIFENALIKYNRPYMLLKGDQKTRLKKAIGVIDKLVTEKNI